MPCNRANLWVFLSVCEAVCDVALVVWICQLLLTCAKVRAHVSSRTWGGGGWGCGGCNLCGQRGCTLCPRITVSAEPQATCVLVTGTLRSSSVAVIVTPSAVWKLWPSVPDHLWSPLRCRSWAGLDLWGRLPRQLLVFNHPGQSHCPLWADDMFPAQAPVQMCGISPLRSRHLRHSHQQLRTLPRPSPALRLSLLAPHGVSPQISSSSLEDASAGDCVAGRGIAIACRFPGLRDVFLGGLQGPQVSGWGARSFGWRWRLVRQGGNVLKRRSSHRGVF